MCICVYVYMIYNMSRHLIINLCKFIALSEYAIPEQTFFTG